MKSMLTLQGYTINHKRVRHLLRKMGLIAIYPQKNLSLGGCSKYFHPYLLRNIEITYPNQVWSTDISYIPMKEGFMYLYAIIDVYSRFIVGWKLSNTLSASNCYKLVEDCIKLYGVPKIINSDQGSQYTTKNWKELLNKNNIQISMDRKGRCKDNIWIERFWRTIKQEYIYINPSDTVDELRKRNR
jgi:putative transposase